MYMYMYMCTYTCAQVDNPFYFLADAGQRLLSILLLHGVYARLLLVPAKMSADCSFGCCDSCGVGCGGPAAAVGLLLRLRHRCYYRDISITTETETPLSLQRLRHLCYYRDISVTTETETLL